MLDKAVVYSLVDLFHATGITQIGITGGEPLLRTDIDDIIGYIYEKGIQIYLSTNCDFYDIHKKIIKEKVSILGVPLDGSTDEVHAKHRGGGNFTSVLNSLNDILGHSIKLKIGTVVTKYNYNDLMNIERIIRKYDENLLCWKIYDLVIYDKNSECSKDLFINPCDYLSFVNSLGSYVHKDKIIYHSIENRDSCYFLIRPDGDVFVPKLNGQLSTEIFLGNLLSTPLDIILDKWNQYVNSHGYLRRVAVYTKEGSRHE